MQYTAFGASQASRIQEINAARQAGLITEREETLAIQEANGANQDQLILLAEIAEAQGIDFLAMKIRRTSAAVRTTSADIRAMGEDINRNFVSGFVNAFEQFINGTLSAN